MATVGKVRRGKGRTDKKKLLEVLTYEVVDGKPIYYRGYKEVLKGKKQPEEVMASGILHARILEYILRILFEGLDKDKYHIATGEVGVKIASKLSRSLDIGIFMKDEIKEFALSTHHYPIPPVVAIEVDTKAEIGEGGFMEYMKRKIDDLLGFGVKRVIWIFTKGEVVLIADDPKSWKVLDWDDEFEVWEGVKIKLRELIKQR